MNIGAQIKPFASKPLERTLEFVVNHGITSVELSCTSATTDALVDPDEYLDDEDAQDRLRALFASYEVNINALGGVVNVLHPDETKRAKNIDQFERIIELASQLDVGTVVAWSGLPAGHPDDQTPNWIVSPFPPEFRATLEYQWEEVAIPVWRDLAAVADDHGVDVAVEPHIGMLVHEPTGVMRLREATNDRIGANVDPAHLWLQGVDVPEAIHYLGDAVINVHASDIRVHERNARVKGTYDTAPLDDFEKRSWTKETVGYGHDEMAWRDVITALDLVGYDGDLIIQEVKTLAGPRWGIAKAAETLHYLLFNVN